MSKIVVSWNASFLWQQIRAKSLDCLSEKDSYNSLKQESTDKGKTEKHILEKVSVRNPKDFAVSPKIK